MAILVPLFNQSMVFNNNDHTQSTPCLALVVVVSLLIPFSCTLRFLAFQSFKYRAATIATKEVVWLRRLLAEIGIPQTKPTILHEDNAACVNKMISNPMVSGRNKHIEMDMHVIRDHFKLGSVTPVLIPSFDQRADLLTKNLPRPAFERHTRATVHCGD